jgi:hypothetical protein
MGSASVGAFFLFHLILKSRKSSTPPQIWVRQFVEAINPVYGQLIW